MGASYEFDAFRLDPAKRLLTRGDLPVALTPKAFDMLLLLVERSGQLVSKEDLIKTLWAGSFVDESNLTQTVFMLRKALGESASDARFIVTVPGRGYRFAETIRTTLPQTDIRDEPPPPIPPVDRVAPAKKFPTRILGFVLLTCALALLGAYLWRRTHARPSDRALISLAVLPFENLTGDAGQDYFSNGLTEELTIQLERLDPQHLEVLAPIAATEGSPDRLKQIGLDNRVQYRVEGSVRKDSNQIRASAKLIRTRDQTYIWAKQYDRQLTNLLALETEIAHDIAGQIRATLNRPGKALAAGAPNAPPPGVEAYDLYLKGRYFWRKRTSVSLARAIDYFTQATVRDPNYAPAFAGLADSYVLYSGYTLIPPHETIIRARAAANRALVLDPNLAEAHTSLAVIAQDFDYDWDTAQKEYRRAIELDPNYATAHHWYAECLGLQGRFDEAFVELDYARRLDPLSVIVAADRAVLLFYSRHYDQAAEQFHAVLDMEPSYPRADMLIYLLGEKHQMEEAMAFATKCCGEKDTPRNLAALAYVYGRSGQTGAARSVLAKLEYSFTKKAIEPMPIALGYIALGDKQAAFKWLQRAFADRSPNLTNLKVNPVFDPLRGDPRFKAILRSIHLAET